MKRLSGAIKFVKHLNDAFGANMNPLLVLTFMCKSKGKINITNLYLRLRLKVNWRYLYGLIIWFQKVQVSIPNNTTKTNDINQY